MKAYQKYGVLTVALLLIWAVFLVSRSLKSRFDTNDLSGPHLTILTYSGLGGKGGFIEKVGPTFATETGCRIIAETTLGAAQILSYLDEEKQRARLDLVMGIDELLFTRAEDVFYAGPGGGFIPTDYGALSFIYRKKDWQGKTLPHRLSDFTTPLTKGKWIIEDPRVSSPGMLFFLFADGIARTSDLKKNWSILAPSWDSAYKMFLAGDSSMVWSYLTSLAYHASKGELDSYGYIDFDEGLPVQTEGMAILNHIGNPLETNPCVSKWTQFVLRADIQARLVASQFMMPITKDVKLPQYFEVVPEVKRRARLQMNLETVDKIVSKFGREVQGDAL